MEMISFKYRLVYKHGKTDWYTSKPFATLEFARQKAGEWVTICLINDVIGVDILVGDS